MLSPPENRSGLISCLMYAQVAGYSKKLLDDYFEKEGQLQAADNLQEETNVKKNALEA